MKHALIIGAGIAGPTMALFLERAGMTAAVYEASPALKDTGGPLNIAPNGMHVLNHLGLAQKVRDAGAVIEANTIWTDRGKQLTTFLNAPAAAFGFPSVSIPRARLHQILVEAAQEKGVPIHYRKRLLRIDDGGAGSVTAYFEDGASAQGDFLVGADGIHSATRRLVLPESPPPTFTGVTSIGGFTDASFMNSDFQPDSQSLHLVFGAGEFFGYSLISPDTKNGIGWWVNLPREKEIPSEQLHALSAEELKKELLTLFKGWAAPVESLIANAAAIRRQNIFDLHDIPRWFRGRVVLIGDAAHAMAPHAGQGASTALEDAMYLARLLRDSPEPPEAVFAQFQRDRRPRTNKIIRQARRYGDSKKTLSPLAVAFRNFFLSTFLKHFGAKANAWAYRYRIDWDSSKKG